RRDRHERHVERRARPAHAHEQGLRDARRRDGNRIRCASRAADERAVPRHPCRIGQRGDGRRVRSEDGDGMRGVHLRSAARLCRAWPAWPCREGYRPETMSMRVSAIWLGSAAMAGLAGWHALHAIQALRGWRQWHISDPSLADFFWTEMELESGVAAASLLV